MAKTTTPRKTGTRSTSARRKTATAAAKAAREAAEIPAVSDEQVTEDQTPDVSPDVSPDQTPDQTAEQGQEQAAADGPLTRRDLINRVADATGVKKPVVRQVIDGMLKELGDTLSSGKALNLPPLGKASVRRQKEMPNAEIIVLKLRRNRAAADQPEDEPIAPAAE